MPSRLSKIVDISNRMRMNEKRLDVIANNLANVGTVGYKRDITFTKVLLDQDKISIQKKTEFKQGDLINTGNPLDLALSGEAFFTVTDGENTYFTKNGKFNITDDGYLIDSEGFKVLGQGGEISFSDMEFQQIRDVTISKSGEVKMGNSFIDTLQIADIEDKSKLLKTGGSRFRLEDGFFTIADDSKYLINQGYLEESNVNPIIEMEEMITLSKNFESIQKIISNYDQILNRANEIGKTV